MWSRLFYKCCGKKNPEQEALVVNTEESENKESCATQIALKLDIIMEVAKFLGTAAWVASFVDCAAGLDPDDTIFSSISNFSNWGGAVGISVGLLSAIASAYVHNANNKNYLSKNKTDEIEVPLTSLQKLAIFWHFISDVGERAAALEFLPLLISKGNLPREIMLRMHIISCLIGAITTPAAVKTSLETLNNYNIKTMRASA